jgi:hypothetical protein
MPAARRGGLTIHVALACLSSTLAARVTCAEQMQVGQINDMTLAIREHSTVLRSDGRTERAVPGLSLYPGDVVRVVPCQQSLGIVFADLDHDAVRLPDPHCEYRVTLQPPMQSSAKLEAAVERFFGLLFNRQAPPRPIPLYSQGRTLAPSAGGGLLIATPGVSPQEVFQRRQALLHQADAQTLTSSVHGLFVLWNPAAPPPYRLTISQNGHVMATQDVASDSDAVLTLPTALVASQPATLIVMAGSQTIDTISIAVVEPAQEPLAPGIVPADLGRPRSATLQGLWLLASGGPDWRLQALAHLQEGAGTNRDFQAARVLRGLVAGEWEPPTN